jgi:hypothetical protein
MSQEDETGPLTYTTVGFHPKELEIIKEVTAATGMRFGPAVRLLVRSAAGDTRARRTTAGLFPPKENSRE